MTADRTRTLTILLRAGVAWRALTASVLALSLLVTSVASEVHRPGDLDADCAITFFALHDASAHRVDVPPARSQDGPPIHCLACHWGRAFRPRVERTYLPAPASETGRGCPLEVTAFAWTSPIPRPPGRSPPDSL